MKLMNALFAVIVSVSGSAYAADKHDHGHEDKPLYGGLLAEVKDVTYEFVAKADKLQLYVRSHGKPVEPGKASAKVTLLAGAEQQEVQLNPAGDRLEAAGSFKVTAGTKAVILVSTAGKPPVTVRFAIK